MTEILDILLFVVTVSLIAYVLYLVRERGVLLREIDVRAEKRFMEMKGIFRKEVLDSSRASIKGRISEQIVPFLEQFKYKPSDARFIGSPIDYVIFDGYTDIKDGEGEQQITVVLADVKCGKSASLTLAQRKIKEAVEKHRVKWETITIQIPSS
jgi:predicted Holliday junction resolvase-like endonuclease